MPRAVRFDRYGGSDVLEVVEVDQPHPGPGEVVVRVVVAATNPGEIMIRKGSFADVWPATFPEGQGNDFSGRVAEVGPGESRFSPGDEVIGFAARAAEADYVRSASDRLAANRSACRGRSRQACPLLAQPPSPPSAPSVSSRARRSWSRRPPAASA